MKFASILLRLRINNPKAIVLDLMRHRSPEGSLSVLVGGHGAMNPAGKVRCDIIPIARGYSRVSQPPFLIARLTSAKHDSSAPNAGVRRISGRTS
jgi:hypothetical protein